MRLGRLVLCLVAAGCGPSHGEEHACKCKYTTDTDVPGEQSVLVCVTTEQRPPDRAAECARGLGVGHVDSCTCERTGGACAAAAPCEQR